MTGWAVLSAGSVRALGLLCLLALALPVAARDKPARFELTPFGGYRIGGSFEDDDSGEEFDVDDETAYGLILNIRDKAYTQWEFGWSRSETRVDIPSVGGGPDKLDLDIDYFQAGGTYVWNGELAEPFLVATVGAAYLNPDGGGDSETNFAFSIGGGWRLYPTSRLGLRLEGRVYGTVLDSDSEVFCESGPTQNQCLIASRSEVLWQWQMLAGATFRF